MIVFDQNPAFRHEENYFQLLYRLADSFLVRSVELWGQQNFNERFSYVHLRPSKGDFKN